MIKIIKKYLDKDFVVIPNIKLYPFSLKEGHLFYYKCLGDKNYDKKFYIIWRDYYGAGFFSNYTFVLCHLLIAKRNNFIPIIDFKNFKTLYNEEQVINENQNAWNYYFESLNSYQLDDVYNSSNVFFCDGRFPNGFPADLNEIEGAIEISKQIKINNTVQSFIEKSLAIDTSYLGVHFRGQEQNFSAGHPFGPTYNQIVSITKKLLQKYNLSKIYIVTEDLQAIEIFEKHFPNKVFYTNSFRTKKTNAYNQLDERINHRYQLGLEILRDGHLLSRCGGIVYSSSNVNEYARLINGGKYIFQCEIKNGINSNHHIYSKLKYKLMKRLPKILGGLPNKIVLKENLHE